MPDTPTPGQVNYEAWQAAMLERWPHLALAPWPLLPCEEQAPWEAAAQAVRTQLRVEIVEALRPLRHADAPEALPDADFPPLDLGLEEEPRG